MKVCTVALISGAQEQSIRTNYIKYNIDETAESPLCRICGTRNETISYIVSEFDRLSQKEYKRRHDSVVQFCEKLGFNRVGLWYVHEPENVAENQNFKLLWGFTIQCDHMIEARRPDVVVIDKVKKETMIVDVIIPGDTRVCNKEQEKIENYSLLEDEISKLWQMKKVFMTPIVVGALRTITTKFEKYTESLEIEIRIGHTQKSALLGTARIVRKVLSF